MAVPSWSQDNSCRNWLDSREGPCCADVCTSPECRISEDFYRALCRVNSLLRMLKRNSLQNLPADVPAFRGTLRGTSGFAADSCLNVTQTIRHFLDTVHFRMILFPLGMHSSANRFASSYAIVSVLVVAAVPSVCTVGFASSFLRKTSYSRVFSTRAELGRTTYLKIRYQNTEDHERNTIHPKFLCAQRRASMPS